MEGWCPVTTQKSEKVIVSSANPFLQAKPMNILANPFAHTNPFAQSSDEVRSEEHTF